MYTTLISVLAAVAVVTAQDVSPTILCGPGSNCEAFTTGGGLIDYRFKVGMGVGSEDYSRRFGKHGNFTVRSRVMKREDVNTKVSMGNKWIDWGCDSDPKKILDVLSTLCPDDSTCDEGNPSTVRIKQLPQGAIAFIDTDLSISARATYENADVKKHLIDAVQTTTDPKVVQKQKRTGGAVRDGGLACETALFPNFVKVSRFVGGDIQSEMAVSAAVDSGDDDLCGTISSFLAAGAGLIPTEVGGIAAGFFGIVSAICGAVNS